jgi:hypothetical protein
MLQGFCCISESPLDVLKSELRFVIGDLDLEIMTFLAGLSGHSARKSAMLFLVLCYKATGDREQNL